MTQNENNNGGFIAIIVFLGFIIIFLWGALEGRMRQQNNRVGGNDEVLKEIIRQDGETTRQILQPQQLPTFDPSKVQGIYPQQQQQHQCVYSRDINGNLIQTCQ